MVALSKDNLEKAGSLILPLLGSRNNDHVAFEYVPVSVGILKVRFAIPPWVTNRETLEIGDVVNFNISFAIDSKTFNQGIVSHVDWDKALGSSVYVAHFVDSTPQREAVFLSIKSSGTQSLSSAQLRLECPDTLTSNDLVSIVLKDLVYLKRGVGVYLGHLFPYFSRISEYPTRQFQALQETVLDQISASIRAKHSKLNTLYNRVKCDGRPISDILASLNFEELRSLVESEVPLDVLRSIFGPASETAAVRSPLPYLAAIQELETRLYRNYNILTTIHAQQTDGYKQTHLSVAA